MGLFCKGFTEEEVQTLDLTLETRSQLIIPCLHDNSLLQVSAVNDEAIDSECARLGVEPEKVGKLKPLQASKAMSP